MFRSTESINLTWRQNFSKLCVKQKFGTPAAAHYRGLTALTINILTINILTLTYCGIHKREEARRGGLKYAIFISHIICRSRGCL